MLVHAVLAGVVLRKSRGITSSGVKVVSFFASTKIENSTKSLRHNTAYVYNIRISLSVTARPELPSRHKHSCPGINPG